MTISTDLANLVYNDLIANGNIINKNNATDIASWIETYISGLTANSITLSENKPDFEQILLQMQQGLEVNSSWIDILTSGTGQTILRFLASVGTFLSLAQERGAQESMLDSARLTSSIYALTRTLGVRIGRKIPCNLTANLYCSSSSFTEIPAYTQFSIAGLNFFNRTPIIFTAGGIQPLSITLYEGLIVTDNYTAPGIPYFNIEVGQNDFSISDTDIIVTNNGNPYTRVTDGLFHYGVLDQVWNDTTIPNGNASIRFGDGIYGVEPAAGDAISVTYVKTMGASGNGVITGQQITCSAYSELSGTTTTISSGGQDQKDREFYRLNAPYMYSTMGRAVTRRDYETIILTYPNNLIFDVKIQGQQELGPNQTAYLNVIGVTVIPSQAWTTTSWNAFASWIQGFGIYQVSILRIDPTPVPIDVIVNVYANAGVDLPSLQSSIENNITTSMTPGRYSIGKNIYLSDISEYVIGPSNNAILIDYFDITSPGSDTILSTAGNQYVTLNSVTVNAYYSTRDYSNRLVGSIT